MHKHTERFLSVNKSQLVKTANNIPATTIQLEIKDNTDLSKESINQWTGYVSKIISQ